MEVANIPSVDLAEAWAREGALAGNYAGTKTKSVRLGRLKNRSDRLAMKFGDSSQTIR